MSRSAADLVSSALFGGARSAEVASGGTAARRRGRVLRAIAAALIAIALFTMSWDKLGNIPLGPYNAKLPALLFSIAALCTIPSWDRFAVVWRQRQVRALLVLVGVIVGVLIVSSLVSQHVGAGLAQVVAVGTGSIAPAVALIALLQDRAAVIWALRWVVAGGYFAMVFGLYQLFAFYVGLPQFVMYTGVGVGGGAGRIAGFNYEPAYFADFVVLVIGAAITRAVLTRRRISWPELGFFAMILILCNVRALLFLLPVLAVLLLVRWRQNRATVIRAIAAVVVVFVINLVALQLVTAVSDAVQSIGSSSGPTVPGDRSPSPGTSPSADTTEAPAASAPPDVLDPDEQSSNAPRLALYEAVIKVAIQHPIFGVGPGSLKDELADVGYVAPNQGAQVVANNVWLQALADGGLVLLLVQGALLWRVAVLFLRRSLAEIQPMVAAWLSVVLVSGMLTSYYFDIKVWVVLGLIVVGTTLSPRRDPANPQPAAAA